MEDRATYSTGRLPVWRWSLAVSVGLILVVALLHRSQVPTVLGRFSRSYALLLLALLLAQAGVLAICADRLRWSVLERGFREVGLRGLATLLPIFIMLELVLFIVGERFAIYVTALLGAGPLPLLVFFPRMMDGWGATLSRIFSKRSVKNAAALSMGVLVSMLALEAILRIAQPRVWKAGFNRPDPELGFRYRGPDANEFGYRDVLHGLKKPPGTWRIASLGDSFGFGVVPLDENYNRVLLRMLPQCRGREVEVLNFGVPGFGPEEYVNLYRHEGVGYDPDVVLLGFFVGNDFYSHGQNQEAVVINGRLDYIDLTDPLRYLPSRWFIKRYARIIARTIEEQSRIAGERRDNGFAGRPGLSRKSLYEVEGGCLERLCSGTPHRELLDLWRGVQNLLLKLRDECKAGDRSLVLAIFPARFQVDTALGEELIKAKKLDGQKLDLNRPQRWLKEFATLQAIPCVDLLPAFRGASVEPLYAYQDTHWNKRGNEIAAKAIAEYFMTDPRLCATH